MKRISLLLLLASYFGLCFSQSGTITKIEIYALEFNTLFVTAVERANLTKMDPQYTRITDINSIQNSRLNQHIKSLEIDKSGYIPSDYRAKLIVHYSNIKKRVFYIASGSGGIIEKDKLYRVNFPFIASIYSFLPDVFFTEIYMKFPEIYKRE